MHTYSRLNWRKAVSEKKSTRVDNSDSNLATDVLHYYRTQSYSFPALAHIRPWPFTFACDDRDKKH